MTGRLAEEQLRTQIRDALAHAKISQAEAARQLGISHKHINTMLTGKATLTLGWAERLATLCGTRILLYVTVPAGAPDRIDRIKLDDLTSDDLDELYDDLDRYTEVVGELNETLVDRAKQAARAENALAFVTRVLELFSLSHADLYDGGLFWRVDDGELKLFANVSDVFAWGGADAEPITPETLPVLEQAYADLKALDADEFTAELYAARQRGERPQGAAYPDDTHKSWRQVSALYDACGPERPIGLGNPKKAPAHKETAR